MQYVDNTYKLWPGYVTVCHESWYQWRSPDNLDELGLVSIATGQSNLVGVTVAIPCPLTSYGLFVTAWGPTRPELGPKCPLWALWRSHLLSLYSWYVRRNIMWVTSPNGHLILCGEEILIYIGGNPHLLDLSLTSKACQNRHGLFLLELTHQVKLTYT